MAARITLSTTDLGSTSNSDAPSYWNAENHTGESYLRAEHWKEDMEGLTLPGRTQIVPVSQPSGEAILRYVEELKMFAALRDTGVDPYTSKSGPIPKDVPSMDSGAFLDHHWTWASQEWIKSTVRVHWWNSLQDLSSSLDRVISDYNHAAFVKLSVRSPKDAVARLSITRERVKEKIRESVEGGCSSEEELGQNICAIRWAAWRGLRVSSGEDALQLLLRSDRIYVDILQHQLFSAKGAWDLNVIVSEFFEGFHPDWEFRGFVSGGVRTGLTAYSPFIFERQQVEKKADILRLIEKVWDRVDEKSRVQDYSVDFAVSPECGEGQCWVIEINAFLPPLAGSGLFSMHDAKDRDIIKNGPFEFRVKEKPIVEEDFTVVKVDEKTGRTTTVIMQPATPEVMDWVKEVRRELKDPKPVQTNGTFLPLSTQQLKFTSERREHQKGGT
ncbi:hypothetical protein PROFUN_04140 [Planoprotostelium fungivorum]|uniref:Uncharacterized protein n=1 Tax=Planoprotostelium fungivorum TaxID=1890364 RepID=A0A2P6NJN9_9EUKA|nr:hypothetical protein PROFUN_04140 [Planoprotostelium fungivorum]